MIDSSLAANSHPARNSRQDSTRGETRTLVATKTLRAAARRAISAALKGSYFGPSMVLWNAAAARLRMIV
jgi:hypothetical protein